MSERDTGDQSTDEVVDSNVTYTGTQVNYYFVCRRKLWLFSHGLEREAESDLVLAGRLLHEHSYRRKLKEVQIGRITIDFIEGEGTIHEVKRSRGIEAAHIHQLLYYLYYLRQYAGVEAKGVLHYPLLKKKVDLSLNEEKEREMEALLEEIGEVVLSPSPPPPIWISYCRSCAYRELCWA